SFQLSVISYQLSVVSCQEIETKQRAYYQKLAESEKQRLHGSQKSKVKSQK
ncbi:MAG: hypothetical protein F6K17_03730, partial [Okeania sp. SIO3C4]|nr:hypothetical protein [Okeania sp. SIO3C4]